MKLILALFLALTTTLAHANYVESPYPVAKGGTGAASFTAGSILLGNGTSAFSVLGGTDNEVLLGHTGAAPTFGTITDAYVDAAAAIAYSKLNLSASIVNADIASGAAIDFSKLAALVSGNILVGSAGNAATSVTMSGDATIIASGALTIANNAVTNAKAAQMAAHTFKGNNTGSTANAIDETVTQATAELNVFGGDSGSGGVKGLVPATVSGDAMKVLYGSGLWASVVAPAPTIVDGGNTSYTILAGDGHIRSTTTLTADQAYTLPVCTGSNLGEKHEIKNLPGQTHNIVLTAAGSDNIDGSATVTLAPGDSMPVICSAFSSAGTWDIE